MYLVRDKERMDYSSYTWTKSFGAYLYLIKGNLPHRRTQAITYFRKSVLF